MSQTIHHLETLESRALLSGYTEIDLKLGDAARLNETGMVATVQYPATEPRIL